MIGRLKYYYSLYKFRKKWKNFNKENSTFAINCFNPENVSIGKETYGGLRIYNDVDDVHLYIGNYCSIAENVVFLLGLDHKTNYVSTFPFKVRILHQQQHEAVSKGDIIIDDDVWIGNGCTILSGVHIGQGAVIAANTVLTKDVPAYSVVGGCPGTVLKYRFDTAIIEKLVKIEFDKMDYEFIKTNIDLLYTEVTEENIDRIIDKFNNISR